MDVMVGDIRLSPSGVLFEVLDVIGGSIVRVIRLSDNEQATTSKTSLLRNTVPFQTSSPSMENE